jgi:hypothetical protein
MLRRVTKSPDFYPDKSVDFCLRHLCFTWFSMLCMSIIDIKKRLLKELQQMSRKSIASALPILLLLVVSAAPSNAQTYTNTQSTTCVGNNNSGCTTTTTSNGRTTVTPARTTVRQVPVITVPRISAVSAINRLRR